MMKMNNANGNIALVKMTKSDAPRIMPLVAHAFEQAMIEALGAEKATEYNEAFAGKDLGETAVGDKVDSYIIVIDSNESGIAIMREIAENSYSLELFSISPQHNGKGIGVKVWNKIEETYPNAEVFETTTPTFAVKNVNFYVNKCKFHIVELLDMVRIAKETGEPNPFEGADDFRYNFRFQKKMK
jgi:GNAT superfamily N-acetyltransferase